MNTWTTLYKDGKLTNSFRVSIKVVWIVPTTSYEIVYKFYWNKTTEWIRTVLTYFIGIQSQYYYYCSIDDRHYCRGNAAGWWYRCDFSHLHLFGLQSYKIRAAAAAVFNVLQQTPMWVCRRSWEIRNDFNVIILCPNIGTECVHISHSKKYFIRVNGLLEL